MTVNKASLPRQHWFKSRPRNLELSTDQVDTDNYIIKDVVMVEEGEAKGHGVHLEREFIEKLVAYDNEHFGQTGIKARFSHPSMSDTAMGKQLGFFRDVRLREVDGKLQAIANLHLLASAELSPSLPNMRSWVMSMAKESPDFMMSSIVFVQNRLYQRNEQGEKIDVSYNDRGGLELEYPEEKIFVEFGEHLYTDLVETGAATNSLFSAEVNQDAFAVRAVEFVRENADIHKFLQENPSKLRDFANQLGIELEPKRKAFSLRDLLFGKGEDPEDAEVMDAEQMVADANARLAQFETELEKARTAATQFEAQLAKLSEQHTAELAIRDAHIEELSQRVETLTDYEAEPVHTSSTVDQVTARVARQLNKNRN